MIQNGSETDFGIASNSLKLNSFPKISPRHYTECDQRVHWEKNAIESKECISLIQINIL